MELDTMLNSRIENKVLLRQMGAGPVDTKRVLINNAKIKFWSTAECTLLYALWGEIPHLRLQLVLDLGD